MQERSSCLSNQEESAAVGLACGVTGNARSLLGFWAGTVLLSTRATQVLELICKRDAVVLVHARKSDAIDQVPLFEAPCESNAVAHAPCGKTWKEFLQA